MGGKENLSGVYFLVGGGYCIDTSTRLARRFSYVGGIGIGECVQCYRGRFVERSLLLLRGLDGREYACGYRRAYGYSYGTTRNTFCFSRLRYLYDASDVNENSGYRTLDSQFFGAHGFSRDLYSRVSGGANGGGGYGHGDRGTSGFFEGARSSNDYGEFQGGYCVLLVARTRRLHGSRRASRANGRAKGGSGSCDFRVLFRGFRLLVRQGNRASHYEYRRMTSVLAALVVNIVVGVRWAGRHCCYGSHGRGQVGGYRLGFSFRGGSYLVYGRTSHYTGGRKVARGLYRSLFYPFFLSVQVATYIAQPIAVVAAAIIVAIVEVVNARANFDVPRTIDGPAPTKVGVANVVSVEGSTTSLAYSDLVVYIPDTVDVVADPCALTNAKDKVEAYGTSPVTSVDGVVRGYLACFVFDLLWSLLGNCELRRSDCLVFMLLDFLREYSANSLSLYRTQVLSQREFRRSPVTMCLCFVPVFRCVVKGWFSFFVMGTLHQCIYTRGDSVIRVRGGSNLRGFSYLSVSYEGDVYFLFLLFLPSRLYLLSCRVPRDASRCDGGNRRGGRASSGLPISFFFVFRVFGSFVLIWPVSIRCIFWL